MKYVLISILTCAMVLGACGKKDAAKGDANSQTTNTKNDSINPIDYNGKIVYIQIDSLMKSYGMYIDLSTEFETKQKKAEADLNARGKSFEKEVLDYQQKAQNGLVTTFQARTKEEELQKKQQDIMADRDRKMNQLGEEQNVLTNKISLTIKNYIEKYNREHKYSMILQTTMGSPIITADPSLDITADVLKGLNEEYLEIKNKETAAKSK